MRDEFEQYYRAGITNQPKPQLENGRMNKNQSSAAYFAGVKDAKSSKENYQKKKAVVNKKAGLAMDTAQHLPLQTRKMYDSLGKALGVSIVFDNNINGNGYYNKSNAELHLKNSLGKVTDTIAIHEIIHRLRQIAPEEFDVLADAVFEYRGVTDADMQEYTELYKGDGLDYYDTLEEIVCDFLGETVSIEEMVDMLPKHKTFIDKFMEVIRDLLKKIRNVQGKEIEKVKGDFEHLLDLLDTTVKAGAENANILATQQSNESDVNSESNKRFSLKQPIEETKDLVAVHNLNEDKLSSALELGGLPPPSIAIVKANQGHNEFGNITMVFDKKTIDPENKKIRFMVVMHGHRQSLLLSTKLILQNQTNLIIIFGNCQAVFLMVFLVGVPQ